MAERVQLQRAEEQVQTAFPHIPEPRPARRIECACGCGRFFYWERVPGCPPKYATDECRKKVWYRKRHPEQFRPASPEYVAEVLAPVRAKLEGIR